MQRGGIPRSRDERARTGSEPPPRRRRVRRARPPAPARARPRRASRPRRGATRRAARRDRARAARGRRRRVRRVLALRRTRAARGDAGDAARAHPRRAGDATIRSGYGLFGRAGTAGYVQRLAVAPEVQRQGFGHALLTDGLRWLRAHGARRAPTSTRKRTTTARSRSTCARASANCPSASTCWVESCDARASRRGVAVARGHGRAASARSPARAPGAGAQQTTTSVPAPRRSPVGLSLVSQSTWVALAADVHDDAAHRQPGARRAPGRGDRDPHRPVDARRAAASTTSSRTGTSATRSTSRTRSAVASLAPDADGNVTITFGLPAPSVQPDDRHQPATACTRSRCSS